MYRKSLRVLLDRAHSDSQCETEESSVHIDPSTVLALEGRKVYSEPNISGHGSGTQTQVAPNTVFPPFTANMDSIVPEQKKVRKQFIYPKFQWEHQVSKLQESGIGYLCYRFQS